MKTVTCRTVFKVSAALIKTLVEKFNMIQLVFHLSEEKICKYCWPSGCSATTCPEKVVMRKFRRLIGVKQALNLLLLIAGLIWR